MANENHKVEFTDEKPQLANELFQLRDILFGEDKREFQSHISELEACTQTQLDKLSKQFFSELSDLKSHLDEHLSRLSDHVNDIDHLHNERSDEIQRCVNFTSDKLNTFEEKTEKTTSAIFDNINRETKQLNDKLTQQHIDALTHLDEVLSELDHNKTDRTTLAKLLTEVAKNLEADER